MLEQDLLCQMVNNSRARGILHIMWFLIPFLREVLAGRREDAIPVDPHDALYHILMKCKPDWRDIIGQVFDHEDYIENFIAAYTKDFTNKDVTRLQIAVATYLIDKLALRAADEKILFTVEVELPVYKAIKEFRSGKCENDDLFDKLDTSKLYTHLKDLITGLTAKVFCAYNASVTLDSMLSRDTKDGDVAEKVVYQHPNKEVSIICNHQRTVSKSHSSQIMRLAGKVEELKGVLKDLKIDRDKAKNGSPH